MAWSQKEQRIATCVPAAATTFTQTDNAHGSNVAVVLSAAPNVNQDYPFPTVAKTSAITDVVYGKLVNFEENNETSTTAAGDRRAGIVTGGIVSFTASAAAAVGDVGKGISGSTTAGAVTVATGGGGRGAIVAIGDAGLTLWVDLDVPPLA